MFLWMDAALGETWERKTKIWEEAFENLSSQKKSYYNSDLTKTRDISPGKE